MTALFAGIGCRRGCSAEEILELLARALEAAGATEIAALATAEQKRGEPGLAEAASRLSRPLLFLGKADLAAQESVLRSPSLAAKRALGLPSVAEAAALAAAGAGARLRLARVKSERATCALAEAAP